MRWVIVLCAAMVFGMGCSKDAAGTDSPEHQETSNRLLQIEQKANGNWDSLSADDKKYVIDNVTHGSETSAKMIINSSGTHKGGPPPGMKSGAKPK